MLIELALDSAECLQRHRRFIDFAIFCPSPSYGQSLRRELLNIYGALALQPLPDNKLVVLSHSFGVLSHESERRVRGMSLRSWAVFCDLSAKPPGTEPNVWPLERIRSLKEVSEGWAACDRDGRQVALLTDKGKRELLDSATCPITVEKNGEPLVTYPPFVPDGAMIRLTGPFVL